MAEPKADRHVFSFSSCAVIVAHPDDETLWAAGAMMMYPQTQWTVISLCRADDLDRSPKFSRALKLLNATGAMGNLDDGPEQSPLASQDVQDMILGLLPSHRFDLIISHGLRGEYTRHLRHEETGKAVMALWESRRLFAKEVRLFAYEDGGGGYLPRPAKDADIRVRLPENIWQKKRYIITDIYGFGTDSFEARAAQRQEAFRRFRRE